MAQDSKNIQSVQRAIDIIDCISNAQSALSLKSISTQLGLNINTTRGLVNTLLRNELLSKNAESNNYSLGYYFLTKSHLVYDSHIRHISEIAHPKMKLISDKLSVACWLQVNFYNTVHTVKTVVPSNSHYFYVPQSDDKLPLHSTASGKLHIAYLSEEERRKTINSLPFECFTKYTITSKEDFTKAVNRVIQLGYATELMETDSSISSIAVPFFNTQNTLAGTISIVATSTIIEGIFDEAIISLKKAGESITDAITRQKRFDK